MLAEIAAYVARLVAKVFGNKEGAWNSYANTSGYL